MKARKINHNKAVQFDNLRGVCIVVSLSLYFTTMQTPHKLRLTAALGEKMDLPDNIEAEVLDYLHLELGENDSDSDAIKLTDLKYEGLNHIDGKALHCWSYPSPLNDMWATVELEGSFYNISLISCPSAGHGVTYEYLWVELWEGKSKVIKIPLLFDKEHSISHTENDYVHRLKGGDELTISTEILRSEKPYQYSVYIQHNSVSIAMHGEVKGVIDYNIDEKTGIKIVVGGEGWL